MTIETFRTRGAPSLVLVAALPFLTSCCGVAKWQCLLVSFDDGVNVVVNNSFEDGGTFVPNKAQGTMSLSPGDTTITGWITIGSKNSINGKIQDIAWVEIPNSFTIPADDGKRFVDLTGFDDVPQGGPFGGVRQTISTVSGFDYVVRFDVGILETWPDPVTSGVVWVDAPR